MAVAGSSKSFGKIHGFVQNTHYFYLTIADQIENHMMSATHPAQILVPLAKFGKTERKFA